MVKQRLLNDILAVVVTIKSDPKFDINNNGEPMHLGDLVSTALTVWLAHSQRAAARWLFFGPLFGWVQAVD
jgi:hypothetical protein